MNGATPYQSNQPETSRKSQENLESSEPLSERHLWQIMAVRDLFWIGLGLLVLWCGFQLRSVFTPVLIALTLAYMVDPAITYWHRQWKLPRPAAAMILIFLALIVIVGLVAFTGTLFVQQSIELAERLPGYLQQLAQRYQIDTSTYQIEADTLAQKIRNNPAAGVGGAIALLSQLFGYLGEALSQASYIGAVFLLIPIYFFFFAWHYGPLIEHSKQYIPRRRRADTLKLLSKMDGVFGNFIRSRILIGLIQCMLFSIGWWLAEVPYWYLLGIATGLLSILPFLGFLGWPMAVLLKYLEVTTNPESGALGWQEIALWPSVAYRVVQSIEIWVLTPWVSSENLNLSPVTILIAVFAGGTAGGLYGILLAIPAAACLSIIFEDVLRPRLEAWANDPNWDQDQPNQ